MYNQGEMKGWELVDGELHSSGAGWDADEDIITKQAYENFELSLEWKVAPENSSEIFFHVPKGNDHPKYKLALEYYPGRRVAIASYDPLREPLIGSEILEGLSVVVVDPEPTEANQKFPFLSSRTEKKRFGLISVVTLVKDSLS